MSKVLCPKYCVRQSIEDALHSHCVHRCPTQIGAADTELYAPTTAPLPLPYNVLVYFADTELYTLTPPPPPSSSQLFLIFLLNIMLILSCTELYAPPPPQSFFLNLLCFFADTHMILIINCLNLVCTALLCMQYCLTDWTGLIPRSRFFCAFVWGEARTCGTPYWGQNNLTTTKKKKKLVACGGEVGWLDWRRVKAIRPNLSEASLRLEAGDSLFSARVTPLPSPDLICFSGFGS